LKLAWFSPTGTTRAVARGIARGMDPGAVELLDLTRPDARSRPLDAAEDELLVVAVPVYMGRVPALLRGGCMRSRVGTHPPCAWSSMAIVRSTTPCSS